MLRSKNLILTFLITINCANTDESFDIIGTWGASIDSVMYREYSFTEKNLIVYDDYFGAQSFKYYLRKDTIHVFHQNNNKFRNFYVLNSSENKLKLIVEADKIINLKRIQTHIDFDKIVAGNEVEFNKYVSVFNSRTSEIDK